MTEAENDKDAVERERLTSLGEELRKEREIREISLQEIADDTKISSRFLEAIESGDHSSLPAPVFTRGFIQEYATFLGLDAEEMVDRYLQQVKEEQEREEREEGPARIPLLPTEIWIRLGIGFLIVVAIVAAIFFFFYKNAEPEPALPEQSQEAVASQEEVDLGSDEPSTDPEQDEEIAETE